jgi:hypothetical protein
MSVPCNLEEEYFPVSVIILYEKRNVIHSVRNKLILGSTMGDYMRPKTAPGNEGGSTLFTLR